MSGGLLPVLGGADILSSDDGPVARQGQRIVPRAAFLGDIAQLADQLPDRRFVVNFCSDRYRFTVGFFAAMLRGQLTLLPSARDAGAVAALRCDYPGLYVVSDDEPEDLPVPWFGYPALDPRCGGHRIPAFSPDLVAAVLFTSGSTGRPNPSPRRWGRLVAGSLAAGAALGVARFPGSPLIATVPHAHSYGLESAVMLPLQHGLLLTSERPFFPADVAAALLQDVRPGILVTTPVHLRALVGDAAGPGFDTSFRAGFVLSATAPLSQKLAGRAETAFNAPVMEIYGCSEAGQLAIRRTIEGPVWRCMDGFQLYQKDQACWASGPNEADVQLADEIELVEGGFILRGRTADLVNVAGKRSSLAYLTRQLVAVEGVEDGVFLMPEDNTQHGAPDEVTRLAAVVVAPGLDAATVLGRLRGRVDPAFLPRPLYVVDRLPRDELGKLRRSEVLRLVELGVEGGPAPVRVGGYDVDAGPSAAAADVAVASCTASVIRISADHPAGIGHFPNNPIVPGAVLLDELIGALFPAGWQGEIVSAKFHHPVRPGDDMAVSYRSTDGSIRFEGRLSGTTKLVVSGVLRTTLSPQ